MKNILIIDDENDIRNLLARIIKLEGYHVFQAENGTNGLKTLSKEKIHAVVCDVKLPDAFGVDLVLKIKELSPMSEVILLTAFGEIQDGVRAIKNGAFDYITKGDDNNKIIPLLSKAVDKADLQYKLHSLAERVKGRNSFEHVIGASKPFLAAVNVAKKVAKRDTTVLLTGETGTGKEVFSQAIHYESPRKSEPFVAINCSALGKDLLESELFGHKAGAFTGASKDKDGLFQAADGGTIFLDEIGEMDVLLQAKLLRVLETGTFMKVGEVKERSVNVRVIAATNRDLKKESEAGNFRLDLYYRLSVFQIQLPSLAQRTKDIPLLANFFIDMFTTKMATGPLTMDKAFVSAMVGHQWKGNIRELKNVIERAVILADGDTLTTEALPFDFLFDENGTGKADPLKLTFVEKQHIKKVLAYTSGNKTKTAEVLGIGLTTLYRKMEEYGIEK